MRYNNEFLNDASSGVVRTHPNFAGEISSLEVSGAGRSLAREDLFVTDTEEVRCCGC